MSRRLIRILAVAAVGIAVLVLDPVIGMFGRPSSG